MEIDSGLWTVIAIIPMAIFFVTLFVLGMGRGGDFGTPSIRTTPQYFTETGHLTKEKPVAFDMENTKPSLVKTILLKVGLAKESQL